MVEWQIKFSKKAQKDSELLKSHHLEENAKILIELIKKDPYYIPPRYEKLVGNLKDCYSRRINNKHRLVYKIYKNQKMIEVTSMFSHYGD